MNEIGRGWQYVVYDLGNGRVLKKIYSKLSQFFLIRSRQIKKGQPYSLPRIFLAILRVNRMGRDANQYIEKLSTTRDLSILGNPVFKGLNSYEQDKVILLKDLLNNCSFDDGKRLFDQYVSLIHKTWQYGFSDRIYNFLENNGVDKNGKLMQSDFGEITTDDKEVLKRIQNKRWLKATCFRTFPEGGLKEYYRHIMDKEMTPARFWEFWRKDL